MRKIIGNLVATWPGRIACVAALALALSLASLCARPAREAEAPVQVPPAPIGEGDGGTPESDAREHENGVHPSGIDYSPANPELSTEIMGWLGDHGYDASSEVVPVSDETVEIGDGRLARLVVWSVDGGEAFIAGQEADGAWTVWTYDGDGEGIEGYEAPAMRARDGMYSIYQEDALAGLMPRQAASGFVGPWLEFASSKKVSGTSARIPGASVSTEGKRVTFLLVVDDFEGEIPETRFFQAEWDLSKKGSKPAFHEVDPEAAKGMGI